MKNIMAQSVRSESDFGKYDELEAKYNALSKQIEAEVRFDAIKNKMDEVLDKRAISTSKTFNSDEIRNAFMTYVRTGDVSELRGVNSYTSAEGGVTVPTILLAPIQTAISAANVMRKIPGVNVVTTTSTSVIPITPAAPTARWAGEAPSGSYVVTAQTFGSVTLGAYKVTANVPVTEETLADGVGVEQAIVTNMATSLGDAEEIGFVSGSGAANYQPTGLLRTTTAGGNAILTYSLGSASGSGVIDNLINAYYTLAPAKRDKSVWIVGGALAKVMRQAKASTAGTFLWEPSMQAGTPAKFLGLPVFETSAAPSGTWPSTTGVVGALLYAPHYTVATRGAYSLRRLDQADAVNGNVIYIANARVDAALHDGNSCVKLIASAV